MDKFFKNDSKFTEYNTIAMTKDKFDKVVGYQGRGTGRPIYQLEYNGEIREVAIIIEDNGYVV